MIEYRQCSKEEIAQALAKSFLLTLYPKDMMCIWDIATDDRVIETVHGRYTDVINYALHIPVVVKNCDTMHLVRITPNNSLPIKRIPINYDVSRVAELNKTKEELLVKLQEVETELEKLG